MTISLAIAFSVAVTGPPTNSEIDLVRNSLSNAFTDFGNEVEAAAIQLCPDLPPDVQAELCPPPNPQAAAPAPPLPAQSARVERVDLVLDPLPAILPETAEAELLGGPVPPRATRERAQRERAQRGRAERPRRATARRANAERSATRTSPRRSQAVAHTAPQRASRPAAALVIARPVAAPLPERAARDDLDAMPEAPPVYYDDDGWGDADHKAAADEAGEYEANAEAPYYEEELYWEEVY
jgi:hypothetical protein